MNYTILTSAGQSEKTCFRDCRGSYMFTYNTCPLVHIQMLHPHLNPKYLEVVLVPAGKLLIAKVRVCDKARRVCEVHNLLLFFHI